MWNVCKNEVFRVGKNENQNMNRIKKFFDVIVLRLLSYYDKIVFYAMIVDLKEKKLKGNKDKT